MKMFKLKIRWIRYRGILHGICDDFLKELPMWLIRIGTGFLLWRYKIGLSQSGRRGRAIFSLQAMAGISNFYRAKIRKSVKNLIPVMGPRGLYDFSGLVNNSEKSEKSSIGIPGAC